MHALAALVALLAREVRADAVVDVGAGQGHLAQARAAMPLAPHGCSRAWLTPSFPLQVLAWRYGLRVLALDAVAPLSAAAAARSTKLGRLAAGSCASCRCTAPPVVVTMRVDWGAPDAAKHLHALLRERLDLEAGADVPRVVLVGLHACGDLTPCLLRTFAAAAAAVAVVAVGCCYNLVTEESGSGGGRERAAADAILRATSEAAALRNARFEDDPSCSRGAEVEPVLGGPVPPGFPLSVVGTSLRLGRRARMLACQSSDRWLTPAGAPSARNDRRQLLRATFDAVLLRFYPEAKPDALSFSKSRRGCLDEAAAAAAAAFEDAHGEADDVLFARAAGAAIAAAGLPTEHAPAEALSTLWRDELAPHAPLLMAFCTLRAVLAAPIESALLLDRLLFLREALGDSAGGAAAAVPLFDPTRSPRNMVLVARKGGPLPVALLQ